MRIVNSAGAELTGYSVVNDSATITTTGITTPFALATQVAILTNPGNGTFNLKQAVVKDEVMTAQLYSATGQCIYRGRQEFRKGASLLDPGPIAPGLYLLRLTGATGTPFVLRCVVGY